MSLKYILTDEQIRIGNQYLNRIQAARDFGDAKAGDLGGFVENAENLSHKGNCWISDNAKAFER